MANLNSWQKVDRVITGLPWGDGANGAATISATPNTRATITGTAGQTTGMAGSTAFSNGDLVVLHQTQGTGAGQWEINKVASGGGTVNLTFQVAHHFTYGTGAQIIKVPRYTTASVNSYTTTSWNGTVGGIEVILANTSITINTSNTISGTGNNGSGSNPDNTGGASRRGFAGANGRTQVPCNQGEGSAGTGGQSTAANGNGGGGAGGSNTQANGAGGGNGTAGTNGSNGATGGSATGSSDGITLQLGGGGGGGEDNVNFGGGGGSGGTTVILISKSVTVSGNITLSGGNGGSNGGAVGGGGAGGSCVVMCNTASLGTTKIVSTGGGGGISGGVGVIAVHHSGTVSGTTNPTFADITDGSLTEATGGNLGRFYFM